MEAAQEERKTVHEHEIRLMEQDLVEMKGVVKTMGERVGRLENTNTGLFAVKHFVTATIAVVGSIIGTTAALWGDEVKYMEMLLYEGGALSLTRVLVVRGVAGVFGSESLPCLARRKLAELRNVRVFDGGRRSRDADRE